MIAKHVTLKQVKKSSFSNLVTYLTGTQNKEERLGDIRVTNCHGNQVEAAALEVLNTQAQNTRSEADKTYHLVVSFRAGEQPDSRTLVAIEERICEGLGFAGHQRVSVVHHDTDNLHLHIAINKIHPTRYTIHEPFMAYRVLAKLCDKLENEYHLEKDNHEARKAGADSRATAMEHHADVESLLGWIKRECTEQLQAARNWKQLHEALTENGLQLHVRANGFVITADNGVTVKASSIAHEFSKARLEQRLGTYQPPPAPGMRDRAARRYEKKPLKSRVDTTELYARYKAAQTVSASARASEWERSRLRKLTDIGDAKRIGRLKRAAIKLAHMPRSARKLIYAVVSNALLDEIAAIHRRYQKECQDIHDRFRRRQWADWLREQANGGNAEALAALRGRSAAQGLNGNTVTGQGARPQAGPHAGHDSVTKKGTIIYRVGSSAVRDDGDKLMVSRGADHAALQAALRMAIARYGNRITVNGSDLFKQRAIEAAAAANLHLTFDDPALERRRLSFIQPPVYKENKHDNSVNVGPRPDRGRIGQAGRAAAASRAAVDARGHRTSGAAGDALPRGHAVAPKSHARSARRAPPPAIQNAMRGMSERGVVHVPEGSKVLLPGHVHHGLEQQGAQPDHGMRRDLDRTGCVSKPGNDGIASGVRPNVGKAGKAPPWINTKRLRVLSQVTSLGQIRSLASTEHPPAQPSDLAPAPATAPAAPDAARGTNKPVATPPGTTPSPASKYIADREQRKAQGCFDIPNHVFYTSAHAGSATYAGSRRVDGQLLALLRRGDEVMVLEVDDATEQRLRRLPLGTQVGVSAQGVIKKKGRRR
jgi:hypothetical protein